MWIRRPTENTRAIDQLGSLESEMMAAIWNRGEFSVRDVHEEFSARLAYTTVMTTVDRLYKKGLLNRRKLGKAYLYTARLTETEYQERVTQHLLGMVLQNGGDRQAVLSCFVDAVSDTDQQMLDRLEQLVKAKRRALRRGE